MKKLLIPLMLVLATNANAQTNVYVSVSAPPSGTGTSWATAYNDLATALTNANNGIGAYNIYVASGTYKPSYIPTSGGARDATFQIYRNNIKLLGGYNATTGNRDISNNITILSGDIGTTSYAGDNCYHVVTLANIATSTTDSVLVEGFTIQNGNANASSSILLIQNSVASYRVSGGGIYMNKVFDNVMVRHCNFTSNTGNYGGALAVDGLASPAIISTPSIYNCNFYANNAFRVPGQAITAGGAFFTNRATSKIVNCIFNSNTAVGNGANPGKGGAMHVTGNAGVNKVINCLFVNNTSGQDGGAFWSENTDAELINCTFYGNDASWSGDGLTFSTPSKGTITNCLIYNHSDGGYSGGTYTTTFLPYGSNPLFVNTSDLDGPDNVFGTLDDGLRLQNASPAKNMGTNSAVTILNDLSGYPRILQTTVDAGAFESGIYVWDGSASTAWNTAANWTENVVPSSTSLAIIPAAGVTNEPTISTSGVSLAYLEIQAGRTMTLSGNSLGLTNNLINNGTIIGAALTDAVEMNGSTTQIISGSGDIDNLTIANSSTIATGTTNHLRVYGLLKVNASKSLTTSDNLTLRSTATRTAMYHNSNTGTVSGNVIVERFIGVPAAKRAWRLLAPPRYNISIANNWQNDFDGNNLVTTPGVGTNITNPTNTNGSDFQSVDFSLKQFDFTTQMLTGVTNINTEIVGIGTPAFLFVRGDRTVGASGSSTTTLKTLHPLFNNDVSISLSPLNANYFISFGNPHASPVDFDLTTRSGLLKRFYTWDPNLGSLGGYVTVDDVDGDGTYTISPSSGTAQTQIIQSGQAYFLQKDNTTGGLSIIFPITSKTTGVINNVFKSTSMNETINATLYEVTPTATIAIDGVTLLRNSAFADSLDELDAPKMENVTEGFGIVSNQKTLSIERRGLLTNINDTVKFHFIKTKLKNYRLTLDVSNFASSQNVYLVDAYTQTTTPLNLTGNTDYDFSITTANGSWDANRFYLVYSLGNPLTVENPIVKESSFTIFPNPVENYKLQVNFTNFDNGLYNVDVINLMGQTVYQSTVKISQATTNHKFDLPHTLSSGLYNIRISKGNNSYEQPFLIK